MSGEREEAGLRKLLGDADAAVRELCNLRRRKDDLALRQIMGDPLYTSSDVDARIAALDELRMRADGATLADSFGWLRLCLDLSPRHHFWLVQCEAFLPAANRTLDRVTGQRVALVNWIVSLDNESRQSLLDASFLSGVRARLMQDLS